MTTKTHLIFTHDGDGYANNMAACEEYAQAHGLHSNQYDVRILERDNYCQSAGLFVSDAAYAKIKRQRLAERNAREWNEE